MLHGRKRGRVLYSFCICVFAIALAEPALAEYRIAAGDVIDFSVAGVPDLKQKAGVDIDGKVTLPLAGSISAAGMTISELRSKVATVLAQREFRQRGYNKTELDVIGGEEITLAIAEYRPVYVDGDVSRPGSQAFRPGLTARQAVSLAGGYDLLRSRIEDPILQTADLQGKYTTAWVDFAKELTRVKRLKSELDQPVEAEEKELASLPLPERVLSTIVGIENSRLTVEKADFEMQKSHLARLQTQLTQSRDIMAQRRDSESEGLQSDADEFARIQDTYRKGLAPNTRIADARRVMLLSSIQSLQSAVELERSKTELEKGNREIDKFVDARKVKLLTELRDANANLETLRSDLKVVSEKLTYVGMRKSLGREGSTEVGVQVVRGAKAIESNLDVALEPGDVIEVTLSLGLQKEAGR